MKVENPQYSISGEIKPCEKEASPLSQLPIATAMQILSNNIQKAREANLKVGIVSQGVSMKALDQLDAEKQTQRSWLILLSFLLITCLFTLPALFFTNKEIAEIKQKKALFEEIFSSNDEALSKIEDPDNRLRNWLGLTGDWKSNLSDLRYTGLLHQKHQRKEWKKQLLKITDQYKEDQSISELHSASPEAQQAYVLHLKKVGAFDKDWDGTFQFVQSQLKMPKETSTLRVSFFIHDCVNGKLPRDLQRKKIQEKAESIIQKFSEEELISLLRILHGEKLLDRSNFPYTVELLEKRFGFGSIQVIGLLQGILHPYLAKID